MRAKSRLHNICRDLLCSRVITHAHIFRNYGHSIAAYNRAHDLLVDCAKFPHQHRQKNETTLNEISDKIRSQSKINVQMNSKYLRIMLHSKKYLIWPSSTRVYPLRKIMVDAKSIGLSCL